MLLMKLPVPILIAIVLYVLATIVASSMRKVSCVGKNECRHARVILLDGGGSVAGIIGECQWL